MTTRGNRNLSRVLQNFQVFPIFRNISEFLDFLSSSECFMFFMFLLFILCIVCSGTIHCRDILLHCEQDTQLDFMHSRYNKIFYKMKVSTIQYNSSRER